MAFPLVALAIPAIAGIAGVLGIGVNTHLQNLSKEEQLNKIINSDLSEDSKKNAIESFYDSGDVQVGLSNTGGDDSKQDVVIDGDGNAVTPSQVVTKEEGVNPLTAFMSSIGGVLPVAACGLGLYFILKGGKK